MGSCQATPVDQSFETQVIKTSKENEVIISATTMKEFATRIWPVLQKLTEGVVVHEVVPRVNKHLPGALNISLRSFTIGIEPAELRGDEDDRDEAREGFQVRRQRPSKNGATLPVGLRAGGVLCHRGFQRRRHGHKIEAELLIDCGPIQDDAAPIVAGLALMMADPPVIDFKLTGVASIAELPPIRHAIFRLIDSAISENLVLPNRLGLPTGTRATNSKPWVVTGPPPIGLLKVQVLSASKLPNQDMSGDVSDPFVEIGIGMNSKNYTTKVVNDRAAPVWNEVTHAFPVYTLFQKVHAQVLDKDFWTPDDSIGSLKDCYIYDLIQSSMPQDLPLYLPDGQVPGATLKLAFEWKWLNPSEPLTEQQLKAPRQFPYVLSVLIDKVVGSQKLKAGFSVKAEIPLAEAWEFHSHYTVKEEDTKKESFIYKRILQKLEEKKMPRHQQIEITGLSEKEIKEILHGEEVKVVPEFDIGAQNHVLVSGADLLSKSLKVSVLQDGNVMESIEIPIRTNIEKDGGPSKAAILKSGDEIWYKLSLHKTDKTE